jgi:hypothetical protein
MSHGALRYSQRGLQTSFAVLALLALAVAALALRAGSASISGEAPAPPVSAGGSPPAPAKADRGATDAYGKLPLAFVPNRGQTDKSVRYYAQGMAHAFYFTPEGAVLTFTKKKKGIALHLTPLGANPNTRLVASERAAGKVNYLLGSEQHRNLPTYRELAYRNVWPGVDLVFRGQGRTLKYELHVQAGADLSKIGFAYGGADGLSVGERGNLLIQTPLGTLRDARPRSYQRIGSKRVPVSSRYAVKSGGNAYGFALGSSYDPRHPLVIDPAIEYSTFLGGSGSDRADGVAIDGTGRAYVTGSASSVNFPTTAGVYDATHNGAGDAFVARLNAAGSALEYSTYIGGTGGDGGLAITLHDGSAYITGHTGSTNFPTTTGAYDTNFNGQSGSADAFVTKLSPDGSALEFST